jgi:DUF917 family protein
MASTWSLPQIRDTALGAGILGTGGGGDPLVGRLLVEHTLQEGYELTVIDPAELADDALVISSAMMGAPTVVIEKLPSGTEALTSLRALEHRLGQRADAVIPMECGGLNSMIPLVVAARAGIPVVDADGMGRAFPELQMETFGVYGVPGSPLAVSDERAYSVIVDTADDNKRMEDFARAVTIRMGGAAYIAEYAMSGADAKRTAIPNTLTLARTIGETVRSARETRRSPLQALERLFPSTIYEFGKVLMTGKIVDVERNVVDGFTQGEVTISAFDGDDTMTVSFRNENLVARKNGRLAAIVPDLISILDVESGAPINTEAVRYGQRVAVMAIGTPDIMRTPEALDVFGPAAFGLDDPWVPLQELVP